MLQNQLFNLFDKTESSYEEAKAEGCAQSKEKVVAILEQSETATFKLQSFCKEEDSSPNLTASLAQPVSAEAS